ncbi:TPA: hypothetical protein N3A33_005400, partial [Salmonella enterica subsp. salamae serovar 28:r:e,n,z15]|nr:hypothetical protein [Salmonella enterica subsp. salamae serovar 28:r:e,n,z15]
NDISLNNPVYGEINIAGNNRTSLVNIVSKNGNVTAQSLTTSGSALSVANASLSAVNGVIHLNGTTGYFEFGSYGKGGAVSLAGDIILNSSSTSVFGVNNGVQNNPNDALAGLSLGYYGALLNMTISGGSGEFYGDAAGIGIVMGSDDVSHTRNTINVYSNQLSLTGKTTANAIARVTGAGGIYTSLWDKSTSLSNAGLTLVLHNGANVSLVGDASQASNGVSGFDAQTPLDVRGLRVPVTFSGDGNVTLTGKSNSGDGLNLRYFDNTGLNGCMSAIGESVSGRGVVFEDLATASLAGASIFGSSQTGAGILLNITYDSNLVKADLNGNTLCGTSASGDAGVQINGNNVTITNGTVNGTVTSGEGSGVTITGG